MSTAVPLAPWQQEVWSQLVQQALPPALLLTGPAGIGKGEVARRIGRRHLCREAEPGAEGCDCPSCHLFARESHPDWLELLPPRAGGTTGVDQARAARDFALHTAAVSPGRTILADADSLTRSAANALLKLLEEPPPGLLLVLTSSRPGLLPPTLLSRLARYSLPVPEADRAMDWYRQHQQGQDGDEGSFALLLDLYRGGPVAARERQRDGAAEIVRTALSDLDNLLSQRADAASIAGTWANADSELPLVVCWRLAASAAMQSIGGQSGLVAEDFAAPAETLATMADLKQLLGLEQQGAEALSEYRRGGRNKAWLLTGLLLQFERLQQAPARAG